MNIAYIENIHSCYPPHYKECIHNISFSIPSQKFTVLTGESGSGKTTILRILAGFIKPCKGRVYIGEKEVSSEKTWVPPEKRRVGVVFQDFALFPHLTVKQNIVFGISDIPIQEQESTYQYLMKIFKLDLFMGKRYPHQLSGGQMQRVSLARSIASRPQLLILDEPFNTIGDDMKEEMLRHLKELASIYKMSILYITHNKNEVFSIADTVAILKEGKLLQQASPKEIYTKPYNAYIARYFGHINILPIQYDEHLDIFKSPIGTHHPKDLNNSKRTTRKQLYMLIRPHELMLSERNDNKTSLVRIEEVKYRGDYFDVSCTSLLSSYKTEITVRCSVFSRLKKNDILSIILRPKHKPHIIS